MIDPQVRDIPLDAIKVSEMNVRGEASAHLDLDELARSIEEFDGLLQPVVLRGDYEDQYPKSRPKYELIIGQRRFNAYREVLAKKDAQKWGKIPAVFGGKMSDDAARVLSLAENLHRLELNHADAAEAVTTLYKRFHKDVHRLSKETGLSVTRINRYLKIKERASKEAIELLRKGKVRDFDVSRALDWAGEDQAKADRMVKVMAHLTPRERKNLVEFAREKQDPTPDDMEQMERDARKPRIRQRLSVDLTEALWQGLEKAEQSLDMQREEIAALAIEKWLTAEGFVP